VKAGNLLAWLKHLSSARGIQASLDQMLRMYFYHRIHFNSILGNILPILDRYDAKFTFAIVASIADGELLQKLVDSRHEIASHSLYHVKHNGLPLDVQLGYIKMSLEILKASGASVRGFRAPYNSYDLNTFRCLEQLGFSYDAGVRRDECFQGLSRPFRVIVDGATSSFLSFPVCHLSDELLDQFSQRTVLKSFLEHIDTVPNDGLCVLQLHPIRIGQPNNLGFLEGLISHIEREGYSMPTLSEVAEGKAKMPAVCLTGDIDCLSFTDYLRRI
jgi:peptidoglycan/xylan/chitin deacetylase (PgdA/CDA1 family)